MAGLGLTGIIDLIVSRSKTVEICDSLHDVQISTTEEDVIMAGIPMAVYSYQTGIIDDAILGEFTEAKLNAFNIFTTGTFTIADPGSEVFILKDAVVNVSLSGETFVKISVLGSGTLHLVGNNKTYATVKTYDNSTVTVEMHDESMVSMDSNNNSSITATINDESVFHLLCRDNSQASVITNDTSTCMARMFHDSVITPAQNDSSSLTVKLFQHAQSVLV